MKKLLLIVLVVAISGIANAFEPIEIEGRYLKVFYDAQFYGAVRDTGSGANNDDSTSEFNFRRNRLGFIGTYDDTMSFYFQTEYAEKKVLNALTVAKDSSDSKFQVLDAQIRFDFQDAFHVYVGKLKHNLTRENLEACFDPLTLDRSKFVYAPFNTSRDLGLALWGNVLDNKLQYRFDIMEGATSTTSDPAPASSFRYTGRLQVSILDPETSYGVKGTYLGTKEILTFGASYQFEPEAAYEDTITKVDKKDYKAYSFDAFFEMPTSAGTFTLSSAYLDVDFDDAYKSASATTASYGLNGQKRGYYVKGGYMLPMMVGAGQLQIFSRYDDFKFANLNNGAVNFYDQNVKEMTFGLNYYIHGQDLKLTAEYAMMDFADEDKNDPNYQDFNTFTMQLQARF